MAPRSDETAKAPVDRRVARTRTQLQHALIDLILKKGYDAITVEDICAAADIGRSTFYAHYTGKDDLKRRGMEMHLRKLFVQQRRTRAEKRQRPFAFSLAMFEHARGHRDLYRALVGGRGGAVALGTIREILSELVREDLAAAAGKAASNATPRDCVVRYIVGAFMEVMTWWLDNGAKLPPERMDMIFRGLTQEGVLRFYTEGRA